jgi:hypothetical protein
MFTTRNTYTRPLEAGGWGSLSPPKPFNKLYLSSLYHLPLSIIIQPPKQKISDPDELKEYKLRKRKVLWCYTGLLVE